MKQAEQNQSAGSHKTGSQTNPAPMPAPPEDLTSPQSEGSLLTIGSVAARLAQTGKQLSATGCATSGEIEAVSTEHPHQRAQRAMNAASWLASPERKLLKTKPSYGLTYNPATGLDEYRAHGTTVALSADGLEPAVADRLRLLARPAALEEISYHLLRLALHRKKTGLGEATLPAFIEDIAGDLRRTGISSLGIAIAATILRQQPRNVWWPEPDELADACSTAEQAVSSAMRQNPLKISQGEGEA